MLIYPISGVYPDNSLPLAVTYQNEGHRAIELPDSTTGLLIQPMTVLETMQEEEIKMRMPLFLIADS